MHKKPAKLPKITTIPDELKIILKTNVPGFQTISYRPNMTVPNEKSKSIEFNPLVKLKQSVIDSIPENVRIREFFDVGLFNSLIYSHGMRSVVSLEQATAEGYVDNNISLTLKTIFPVKSIIFINKEPYSIADVHWTQSDWNINVKPKAALDSRRVKDPYMYQAIIQQEMVQGERQLANLSTDVAYGDKYDGPKNPLVLEPEETPVIEPEEEPIKPAPLPPTPLPPTPLPPTPEEPVQPTPLPPPPLPPSPLPLPPIPEVEPIEPPIKPLPLPPSPLPPLPLPPIPIDKNCPDLPAPAPSKKSLENVVKSEPVSEPIFEYNKIRVIQVRKLFKKNYYLINSIFKNLDPRSTGLIFQNYVDSSKVKVKEGAENISVAAYDQSVDGLKIVKNKGGGDCFFIAVADGINYYNYKNQNNKIQIGKYGSGELLITQQVVRQLTYDFVYSNFIKDKSTEEVDQYFEQAIIFVNDLNDVFERHIKSVTSKLQGSTALSEATSSDATTSEATTSDGDDLIDPVAYDNIKIAIYTSHPNYLVTYDEGIPKNTDDYYKPFRLVKKDEVQKYMLSKSYWGDETAIEAIKDKLGLLVVPLETIEKNYVIERIKLTRNWFLDEEWDKYMFLLQSPGHFELIQFTYQEKMVGKSKDTIFVPVKVTIFNRFRSAKFPYSKYIPPIYILFIIFGGLYISLNDQLKRSFTLLHYVFEAIFASFNKIKDSAGPDEIQKVDKGKFIGEFLKYFPETDDIFNAQQLALIGGDQHNIHSEHNGHNSPNIYAAPNTNAYGNPPYYRPLVKSNNTTEAQICYTITVQLMLKKGSELTDKDLAALTCDQKRNAITSSYSKLMGKAYTMPPDYNNMPSTFKSTTAKSTTDKSHAAKRGGTLKVLTRPSKTNKTMKRLHN
jgi:hypothetical protein